MDDISLEPCNPSVYGSSLSGSVRWSDDEESGSLFDYEDITIESSLSELRSSSSFSPKLWGHPPAESTIISPINDQCERQRLTHEYVFGYETEIGPKQNSTQSRSKARNGLLSRQWRLVTEAGRKRESLNLFDTGDESDDDDFEDEIRQSGTGTSSPGDQTSQEIYQELGDDLDLFRTPFHLKRKTSSKTSSSISQYGDDDSLSLITQAPATSNSPSIIRCSKHFPFLIAFVAIIPLIIFQINQMFSAMSKKDESMHQVTTEIHRLFKQIQDMRMGLVNQTHDPGGGGRASKPLEFLDNNDAVQSELTTNILINWFGISLCISISVLVCCYVIRQIRIDIENLHRAVAEIKEHLESRRGSVFMVELTHQGDLSTGARVRLDTFLRFMTRCEHYDKLHKEYVVPLDGSYFIGACVMQQGAGEMDLHVCNGLNDRRWIGRSYRHIGFVNGSTIYAHLKKGTRIWAEVETITGSPRVQFCTLEGCMV